MAIRLRRIENILVALCAARSVSKENDVYLDDGQHYALAEKFWRDYAKETTGLPECDAEIVSIVDIEESNNSNREAWDKIFGD